MASRESALWKWLSKAKEYYGPALHMTRIENKIGSGTLDVEGCLNGKPFWLELKCGEVPARETTIVRIRVEDSQVDFARDRLTAGGACGFLIRLKTKTNSHLTFLLHGRYGYDIQRGLTLPDYKTLSVCDPKPAPQDIISAATYLKF